MIRTVMVEDEPLARDLLRSYIALHGDLELVAQATDGRTGLKLVNELAPDLLLLDIHLPEISGIELARQMRAAPAIVFITAHDAHAMTAFELGAFDYLLKPVLPERFALAMERVRERRQSDASTERLHDRIECIVRDGYLQRFFVRHLGRFLAVHVTEIVRMEADDDYTAVYVAGKRLLVHVPLREMAARLDPANFVRVHRSHLVHLANIRSAQQEGRRLLLHLSDGSTVPTSRAGMQALQGLRL